MIAVGEQSGQLEQMLDQVAAAYDEEITVQTQKVTSLLEPLLIVAMALVVGFIVISVMLPILKISDLRNVRRGSDLGAPAATRRSPRACPSGRRLAACLRDPPRPGAGTYHRGTAADPHVVQGGDTPVPGRPRRGSEPCVTRPPPPSRCEPRPCAPPRRLHAGRADGRDRDPRRPDRPGRSRTCLDALSRAATTGIAETQMATSRRRSSIYMTANKKLPQSLEDLTQRGPQTGDKFLETIPKDPWGNPYEYQVDQQQEVHDPLLRRGRPGGHRRRPRLAEGPRRLSVCPPVGHAVRRQRGFTLLELMVVVRHRRDAAPARAGLPRRLRRALAALVRREHAGGRSSGTREQAIHGRVRGARADRLVQGRRRGRTRASACSFTNLPPAGTGTARRRTPTARASPRAARARAPVDARPSGTRCPDGHRPRRASARRRGKWQKVGEQEPFQVAVLRDGSVAEGLRRPAREQGPRGEAEFRTVTVAGERPHLRGVASRRANGAAAEEGRP